MGKLTFGMMTSLDGYIIDRNFAVTWHPADKIVVSRTLDAVSTKRTRLVRELSADDIRKLEAESEKDIGVSGPTLAAAFLAQGLIDEISIDYVPVAVGGGRRCFKA